MNTLSERPLLPQYWKAKTRAEGSAGWSIILSGPFDSGMVLTYFCMLFWNWIEKETGLALSKTFKYHADQHNTASIIILIVISTRVTVS